MVQVICFLHFKIVSLRGGGLLAGILPQIRHDSAGLLAGLCKIEKVKPPLFQGPMGTGGTNDWCITANGRTDGQTDSHSDYSADL